MTTRLGKGNGVIKMIIDFHTHVFPEEIARRTLEKLAGLIEEKPYTDGTLEGIKRSMQNDGVDISVVLPIVTRPKQFQTINEYASNINGKDGIISFGGIHPRSEKMREEIDVIKNLGLKGIKLHPDFQETFIDEPCYIDLISYALEKDLIVSMHAGIDEGLPHPVHCPPEKVDTMLRSVQKNVDTSKIILAHTGGFHLWNEVEQILVGRDVYFDISFSREYIPKEQMERIIKNHGPSRILFGSDSPWDGQREGIDYVRSLAIAKIEQEMILGENGRKLLDI